MTNAEGFLSTMQDELYNFVNHLQYQLTQQFPDFRLIVSMEKNMAPRHNHYQIALASINGTKKVMNINNSRVRKE